MRVWGWRTMAGRTCARRIRSETGDRSWLSRIAARTFSMLLRRVIWLGCPGCARSPRRGPCGYEGELSVKRVSEWCDGSQVRAASSQGGALVAGGESDTKENPRHSAQPKRLKKGGGCGGASLLLRRALALCLVRRRVLRFWARGIGSLAGPPRRLPPRACSRPSAPCCRFFVAACSRFVSCRVVMRCHWVSPPCFLIVYAPAMRAVAYYALSGVVVASAPHGSERGIISRAGAACACAPFFCEAAAAARRVVAWSDAAGAPECAAWLIAGGVE